MVPQPRRVRATSSRLSTRLDDLNTAGNYAEMKVACWERHGTPVVLPGEVRKIGRQAVLEIVMAKPA